MHRGEREAGGPGGPRSPLRLASAGRRRWALRETANRHQTPRVTVAAERRRLPRWGGMGGRSMGWMREGGGGRRNGRPSPEARRGRRRDGSGEKESRGDCVYTTDYLDTTSSTRRTQWIQQNATSPTTPTAEQSAQTWAGFTSNH
jgi:hypothetical protein